MKTNSITGSNWNIWDLHVHSPASFGGDDYTTFIANLQKSEAAAIGINDYCTIEGYKKIKEHGGVRDKVIFPVIEFRAHNIIANRKGASPVDGGTKINFHLIFNNEESLFQKIETFVNSLSCYDSSGSTALLGSIPISDLPKITFDLPNVLKRLDEFGLREHCLMWLPYDEYGGIDDIDPDDNFFKMHLIKSADLIGSSRDKQIDFFKWNDQKFTEDQYRAFLEKPKPCIKGSDSHQIDYPFGRLKNDKSEPIERFCWIKGDLTFNGLKQIVYEPDRVSISKEPELIRRIKANPHKFFSELSIDKEAGARTTEYWFQNVNIPFNSGLVAIIGKKGNGKSAIADIIGLCGNAKINKDDLSFLHRDKFKNPKANKAKDFKAKLFWLDRSDSGDINLTAEINPLQEERIKYIPQNYLEKLCVNEEQKEFEEELKKIIYAHIPAAERLGQSKLDELIALKQSAIEEGINKLQLDISRINKNIARLEAKRKVGYKVSIEQEISNKESELTHHNANVPVEKPKPDEDETQREANRATLEQIENKKAEIKQLEDQKKALELELNSNNIAINELDAVKNSITQLDGLVTKTINEKKPVLEKYILDINAVISFSSNVSTITSKIESYKTRNTQINASISGSDNTKGIIAQVSDLNFSITELQSRLDQNQKEYQEYLRNKEVWERRKTEIIGSAELNGSLEYFKSELAYINNKLADELSAAVSERAKICREIFALKQQLLSIYSTLYQPITQVLAKESSFDEEYNIKVDASLIIKAFSDKFIAYINQKSRGTFAGATEGRELIDQMLSVHSVTSVEEVEEFISAIDASLNQDQRAGYGNETRYPDEQLKRDNRVEELYDFIYGLEYIHPQFKLKLGAKELKELSPGERGAILLIFYLFLDIDNKPLVIDQPEENLDNESIYYYLVHFIKKAKQKRQIVLITHNPNLAVVCDAEQIIHMTIDKQNQNKVSFISGAIENPVIAKHVINILEGTKPAFDNRRLKYNSIVG